MKSRLVFLVSRFSPAISPRFASAAYAPIFIVERCEPVRSSL